MKYDLRKLAQVVAVARAGSFSAAAEQLHMTQPALSRNIAALENALGIRFFERGRGGVDLTPAGAVAVEEIASLMRQADSLEYNLKLFGQGRAGRVAFGLGPMVGSLILPTMATAFLAETPQLQMRAVLKSGPELLDELLHDRIELFFCGREQIDDQLDTHIAIEPVARVPIACVVRAGHPLAKDTQTDSSVIRDYPVLSGLSLPGGLSRGGELTCDNFHILRDVVLSSDGIWFTSPLMVASELEDGRMIELHFDDGQHTLVSNICMFSRAGFSLSPGARRVKEYVTDYLNSRD